MECLERTRRLCYICSRRRQNARAEQGRGGVYVFKGRRFLRGAVTAPRVIPIEQPLQGAVRVSATTVGRCVPVAVLTFAVLPFIPLGGCAPAGGRSADAERPSVTVETRGAHVIRASAAAGANEDPAPATQPADPATPDLASRTATQPARLPPPKIVPGARRRR
jgi:hypothetical protein